MLEIFNNKNPIVCIQGLGYVGSAMAIAVSSRLDINDEPLFNVIGLDVPNRMGKERIDSINLGIVPFKTSDKKLSNELKKSIKRGNLIATSDENMYSKASVVLVSINCDLIKSKGKESIALDPFTDSIKSIANYISENTLVIVESTVPPGTCEKIIYPLFKDIIYKRKLNIDKFYLAHSYERVMPGKNYFNSIINFWRVFAGINSNSSKKCEEFLSQVINTLEYPLTKLSNTTASETAKILENSYRAVNIAFVEEWGRFAEDSGVDLYEVIDAIRIRPTHSNIRQPGFGVGGYCLTKDPLFAKIAARDILKLKGHDFTFSSQAVKINTEMPLVTLNKIKNHFNNDLIEKKILLMGITYRQDVSDTRFSPSEIFYNEAKAQGAEVIAYDPLVSYWEEIDETIETKIPDSSNFDAIVFAVPHKEFKNIKLKRWIKRKDILLFDANNVLTNAQVLEINNNKFTYLSIGRG